MCGLLSGVGLSSWGCPGMGRSRLEEDPVQVLLSVCLVPVLMCSDSAYFGIALLAAVLEPESKRSQKSPKDKGGEGKGDLDLLRLGRVSSVSEKRVAFMDSPGLACS